MLKAIKEWLYNHSSRKRHDELIALVAQVKKNYTKSLCDVNAQHKAETDKTIQTFKKQHEEWIAALEQVKIANAKTLQEIKKQHKEEVVELKNEVASLKASVVTELSSKVAPVIERVGQRLQSLEEAHGDLKEQVETLDLRLQIKPADYQTIVSSKYFDAKWYRTTYLPKEKDPTDFAQHYLSIGWRKGNDPSPLFSTTKYLANNPDVKKAGMNPLLHYIRFGIKEGRKIDEYFIEFYWVKIFRDYFAVHDMEKKVRELKDGLDEISCEYVDRFMELSKYWKSYYKGAPYTPYDVKLRAECEAFNFVQPYPEISKFNEFIFSNKYGLADLPKEAFNNINGRDIVDGGGFNGDTPVLFTTLFPNSKVYVYEPLKHWMNKIQAIKENGNLSNLMLVNKGLGDREGQTEIKFHVTKLCEITTLNKDYAGDNLGLIKLDTEGYETKILAGGARLIKKHKPVLVIAIYHTPQDFFDLKRRLKKLNPDYKFMIRRSEQVIPTADLVLIAY